MSEKKSISTNRNLLRRDFLKGATLSAGTAAVAVVGAIPSTAKGKEKTVPANGGYQETEHVRTYYELARF